MRQRPVLLLASLATLMVIFSAGPALAADPWLDENFENDVRIFSSVVQDMKPLGSGHVGAGARSVIPSGEHWGSSGHWYFDEHGVTPPDEVYWRYYLRFPTGFYIEPPNRGKLPGPANLYTYNCLGNRASTEGAPCWSARMLFSRDYTNGTHYQDGPSDKTLLGFYTYHLDGPSNRGDILTWDESVGMLDHGQWYCVEGRLSLNTPGQKDGILQGWVDGTKAFERTDMRWRRSSESFLDVDSFWFDVYYGGDESVRNLEIHFDSLAVGPERIGCDDSWDGTFADDDGSPFEADIEWLAASGITKGCGDVTFCPKQEVTRGQMAAFLGRGLDLPPVSTRSTFADDDGTTFEADIERLAASGITKGCGPTSFCPDSPVTRGQMAAFLARALDLPQATDDFFTDDDGSTFENDINRLAQSGITKGCSDTSFCPNDEITREQMAAFLHRSGI